MSVQRDSAADRAWEKRFSRVACGEAMSLVLADR